MSEDRHTTALKAILVLAEAQVAPNLVVLRYHRHIKRDLSAAGV